MDNDRFDTVVRHLATAGSRRSVLRLVAGALAASTAGRSAAAATCVPAGRRCGGSSRCCDDATCDGQRCRCKPGRTACFAGLWSTEQLGYPSYLALEPGGRLFVTDYTSNRVHIYSSGGKQLVAWGREGGRKGSGNGEFNQPNGVAVGPDGSVYVADGANARVVKFSSGGDLLGEQEVGGWPRNVAVAHDGKTVYVSSRQTVYLLDADLGLRDEWCCSFDEALGVAPARDGKVYISDFSYDGGLERTSSRVVQLSAAGELMGQWGSYGRQPGQFRHAEGVVVSRDGRVFVADWFNRRIQKFLLA
jgi:tripartite motif-containing protein 71